MACGYHKVDTPSVRETFPLHTSFKNIDGNMFKIGDFNSKIVVINFMFTKCKVCGSQTAYLQKFDEFNGVSIAIVSISVYPEIDTGNVLGNHREENEAYWIRARDVTYINETNLILINSLPPLFWIKKEE